MDKYFNINQKAILNDVEGYTNILNIGSVVTHENIKYTYIASGLMRDVFRSEDGLKVLKLPKYNVEYGTAFKHNELEVRCYAEAPDWCKNNIAKSELTKEGFVLQEFVDVKSGLNYYYRELGVKTDGTWVVFDCDIFLDSFNEPEKGFKYQEVFSGSECFGSAYKYAVEIPKIIEKNQMLAMKKHFPNSKGSSTIYSNGLTQVFVDGVEISNDLAEECGLL